MTNKWTKYNDAVVNKVHGPTHFYREMYEGNHAELFPRAIELIKKGEIVDSMLHGKTTGKRVQVPYIVVNISKVIVDIAATYVSGSLGEIKSSLANDQEQNESVNEASDGLIDGTDDETANGKILNFQQELIEQIALNSNLAMEHRSNVVQHQIDGGLVGVPWKDDSGISIEFKSRDMYYPHKDGKGADLIYVLEDDEDEPEYLHVYRERVEAGNLTGTHMLFTLNREGDAMQVDDDVAKEVLDMKSLKEEFKGRSRQFMQYWANDKTFMNPLGVSSLKGQESKQDEINWTVTRSAITFERNGKPRLAVSKEVMAELKNIAAAKYGEENDHLIDHRDLEVTTFDDKGKALEIIQLDISKIGDFDVVKNYIKMMLMETQTAEKAVDFYMDGGTSGAASGIAKYYDLLITLMKAQRLQKEYIHFLQDLFEGALWLANQDDPQVRIERPDIEREEMLKASDAETKEKNNKSYAAGTQSLEENVRQNNPGRTEEWYEAEIARIEEGNQSDDSTTLVNGRSTLLNALDNRPITTGAAAVPEITDGE